MKIGIIGSGNVGGALGKIWARNGHEIMFSSRNPDKLKPIAESAGTNTRIGSPADAAEFGEVVVLAVPWSEAKNALQSAGSLRDKILIDCTNPLKADYSGLAVFGETSAGEEVVKIVPEAMVVKAFHTTFAALMQSESRMFEGLKPTGFYCGNNAHAKSVVSELIRETGLEPLDVGPLSYARYLEPMAMLMISLGFAQKLGTNIALKLLRR